MMEFHQQRSIYFQQMEKAAKSNDGIVQNYRTLVPILAIVFQILLIITASIFLEDATQEADKGSSLTFISTSSVAIVTGAFNLAISIFSIKDFDSMRHIWCAVNLVCSIFLAVVTSVAYTYHAQDLGTGQLYLITSLMSSLSTLTLVVLLYLDLL